MKDARGAVLSSAAPGVPGRPPDGAGEPAPVPQAPSEPEVTQLATPSRTNPGFVAVTVSGPLAVSASRALPSAPVVAVCAPADTVAPSAGVGVPSKANCSTRTVTDWPGDAVAGTPLSRSGSNDEHRFVALKQSAKSSTSSCGCNSAPQSPVEALL